MQNDTSVINRDHFFMTSQVPHKLHRQKFSCLQIQDPDSISMSIMQNFINTYKACIWYLILNFEKTGSLPAPFVA